MDIPLQSYLKYNTSCKGFAMKYTASRIKQTDLPFFMKFNADNLSIKVLSTAKMSPAPYTIAICAVVQNNNKTSNCSFAIDIKINPQINEFPPYFPTNLKPLEVTYGEELIYKLPNPKDKEGTKVSIKIDTSNGT